MPIPLYISPSTPLPGPADFAGIIERAFDAKDRKTSEEQRLALSREQMASQQRESSMDRSERSARGKETSEYNKGMLELYRGDRDRSEKQKFEDAARKAMASYMRALERQQVDPAGLIRAEKELAALGITPPAQGGPGPGAAAPGGAPAAPINRRFDTAPLDLGSGPMPLRGLY